MLESVSSHPKWGSQNAAISLLFYLSLPLLLDHLAVSTQTYFHLKQTRKQTNQQIPLQPTSYNPHFWPISLLPLADILKRSVSPHSCQFLSSRGLWSTSPSGLPPTSLQKLFLCPSPQYLTQSVISLDFQDDLLGFPITCWWLIGLLCWFALVSWPATVEDVRSSFLLCWLSCPWPCNPLTWL